MSKRERKPPSKPSNAYLISFGDTMTAMLAFFIVLNTLAQEQTGANLHSGTGSFVSSLDSMGLPGSFSGDKSKRVQQFNDSAPKYIVTDGEEEGDNSGNGPDEEDNEQRVIDREYENLQRLVVEFNQLYDVKQEVAKSSSVVFDIFERIGKPGNMLPKNARKVIVRSIAVLSRPEYDLEIKIWAATPSKTAMARSTKLALELKQELIKEFPVLAGRADGVRATASLWPFSDDRRPIISLVVIKKDSN